MAIKTWGGTEISPGIGATSGASRNPYGPAKLATAGVNSTNGKTGTAMATFASQASCPDGGNNKSGFLCPLYGKGCYAEYGNTSKMVGDMNRAAGGDTAHHKGNAVATPLDVAKDEAAAIKSIKGQWDRERKNDFVRIHVVGDCVTQEAAEIVSDALQEYSKPMEGGMKNIWGYTHGWRDVHRGSWGDHTSMLASVDNADDLSDAHGRGYACAMVVEKYVQEKGKNLGVAYKIGGGFTVVPCPNEVEAIIDDTELGLMRAKINEKGIKRGKGAKGKPTKAEIRQMAQDNFSPEELEEIQQTMKDMGYVRRKPGIQCITCKLCLNDDRLRKNNLVIAFAAHGSGVNEIAKRLSNIRLPSEGVA